MRFTYDDLKEIYEGLLRFAKNDSSLPINETLTPNDTVVLTHLGRQYKMPLETLYAHIQDATLNGRLADPIEFFTTSEPTDGYTTAEAIRSAYDEANGLAVLDENRKVSLNRIPVLDNDHLPQQISSEHLPSYVDDVEEYASFADLPNPGERGKIYITIDDNKSYRWSGTQYILMASNNILLVHSTSTSESPDHMLEFTLDYSFDDIMDAIERNDQVIVHLDIDGIIFYATLAISGVVHNESFIEFLVFAEGFCSLTYDATIQRWVLDSFLNDIAYTGSYGDLVDVPDTDIDYFYIQPKNDNTTIYLLNYTQNYIQIEYSFNKGQWTQLSIDPENSASISIDTVKKLYLRSDESTLGYSSSRYLFIDASDDFKVGGKIVTLISKQGIEPTTLPQYCFDHLLATSKLYDASELILTKVTSSYSYDLTFAGSLITKTPILQAEEPAMDAYYGMFYNCSSINTIISKAKKWLGQTYFIGNSVLSTGDFYNLGRATDIPTGDSGCPTNFIMHTPIDKEEVSFEQADWQENDPLDPSYIKNKPSIVQSDWAQTNNTQLDYIKNKPEIPSVPEIPFVPAGRVPTSNEWDYLLFTRPASTVNSTQNARFCKCQLNVYSTIGSINGLLILPDVFTLPTGITMLNINGATGECSDNQYNSDEFNALINAGCVFLPLAGYRAGTTMNNINSYGFYASSTNSTTASIRKYLFIHSAYSGVGVTETNKSHGTSVRLIMEHENGLFSFSATTKADIAQSNLKYHCLNRKWAFAERPYDFVGSSNSNIAVDYNGWIDVFGYGTSGWNSGANAYQPWSSSSFESDYINQDLIGSYEKADWGYMTPTNTFAKVAFTGDYNDLRNTPINKEISNVIINSYNDTCNLTPQELAVNTLKSLRYGIPCMWFRTGKSGSDKFLNGTFSNYFNSEPIHHEYDSTDPSTNTITFIQEGYSSDMVQMLYDISNDTLSLDLIQAGGDDPQIYTNESIVINNEIQEYLDYFTSMILPD